MSSAIGTVAALSGGTMTLTVPTGMRYVFVQAQDTTPINVSIPGFTGGPDMAAASSTGAGDGGWLDSIGFPFLLTATSITLTGTGSAKFCAWATATSPLNVYPVPEQVLRS